VARLERANASTTAIYTGRADIKTVIYESPPTGGQMMDDLRRQAERFGTEFRMGSIIEVDKTYHQAIVAARSGAMAGIEVERFLMVKVVIL